MLTRGPSLQAVSTEDSDTTAGRQGPRVPIWGFLASWCLGDSPPSGCAGVSREPRRLWSPLQPPLSSERTRGAGGQVQGWEGRAACTWAPGSHTAVPGVGPDRVLERTEGRSPRKALIVPSPRITASTQTRPLGPAPESSPPSPQASKAGTLPDLGRTETFRNPEDLGPEPRACGDSGAALLPRTGTRPQRQGRLPERACGHGAYGRDRPGARGPRGASTRGR